MNFKFSISILISTAYFLTLLIFKQLHSSLILENFLEAAKFSLIFFAFIYLLVSYISISFDRAVKKEAEDAISLINNMDTNGSPKPQSMHKSSVKVEYAEPSNTSSMSTKAFTKPVESTYFKSEDKSDIQKIKSETGTQFEKNINTRNINI